MLIPHPTSRVRTGPVFDRRIISFLAAQGLASSGPFRLPPGGFVEPSPDLSTELHHSLGLQVRPAVHPTNFILAAPGCGHRQIEVELPIWTGLGQHRLL